MENETRKYDNLYVSKDGRIFDCSMNEIAPHDAKGYDEISYRNSTYKVHITVAKCFPEICGEWFEGCHVHHKDRNRKNNDAENLAVLTPSQHHIEHSRKIGKYDNEFNLITIYNSYKEALSFETFTEITLRKAIKEAKKIKGFYYLYID